MISALDTNVVSAIWSKEPGWTQVTKALNRAKAEGGLLLCGVAYAELLAHPRVAVDSLGEFLEETGIRTDFVFEEDIWREAGLRFAAYAERRRREAHPKAPRRMIADFLIGAHALIRADRLITLDRGRYARDLPELRLLDPPE